MSVIVEFTIPTDRFLFGTVLSTAEGMELTLERVVPTNGGVLPFFWATGANFEGFERHVLEDPNVAELAPLDRVLYRIEWVGIDDLVANIGDAQETILEVLGTATSGRSAFASSTTIRSPGSTATVRRTTSRFTCNGCTR